MDAPAAQAAAAAAGPQPAGTPVPASLCAGAVLSPLGSNSASPGAGRGQCSQGGVKGTDKRYWQQDPASPHWQSQPLTLEAGKIITSNFWK